MVAREAGYIPLGSFKLLKLARSSELSRSGGFLSGGRTSWLEPRERLLPFDSEADCKVANEHLNSFEPPSSEALPSIDTVITTSESGFGTPGIATEVTVPGTHPASLSGSQTRVPLVYTEAIVPRGWMAVVKG